MREVAARRGSGQCDPEMQTDSERDGPFALSMQWFSMPFANSHAKL